MKVIIDTDPGTDDVLALIMALNSPELDILALTTVEGNATLEHTTNNALAVLEYMNRAEIPVHSGESTPLVGEFYHAYNIHGPAGLTVSLPAPQTALASRDAVGYITQTALDMRAGDDALTLIALGPLTNVARALQRDARLKDALGSVLVMGGTGDAPGNVTPYAEFNIWDDPHAANVVFQSGAPVTLIGLDICRQTAVARDNPDWFGGDTPGERLAARILTNWFQTEQVEREFNLHDPLTIAAALRPDLITTRAATLRVETEDVDHIGAITHRFTPDGGVSLAVAVDSDQAMAFMRCLLAG